MILILDAGPVFGGLLVLLHGTDISDEPVAVFGEPVDDRPRYVGHRWHSKSEMGIV
jgi:hypothetical protein